MRPAARTCAIYYVYYILAILLSVDAARICERSNYCSLRKIKGYVGPLDTADNLREALEATAYQKELIVFSDNRLSDSAQTLSRFREAGYAHVLVVLDEPLQCHHLRSVLQPWLDENGPISCGTYAKADNLGNPYRSHFKYLARGVGYIAWWRKWFTVGRAVALGYNVMAVDADVVVLDDWYWLAKQPPLSNYHMLSQNEWGWNFNGGFSYIQNASSSGPVVWILFEALHRAVRWAEDDSALQSGSKHYRSRREICVDDQGLLQECMFSAVVGRPVFPSLLALYKDDPEAYRALGGNASTIHNSIVDPVHEAWRYWQSHNISEQLAPHVCEYYMERGCKLVVNNTVKFSEATLLMPHSGGKWPSLLGGYPFSRVTGPLTMAYRQAYKDLGVPLPPDPEDPTTETAARATPPEQFVYLCSRRTDAFCLGCWAEGSWWMTGRHGWWHRGLLPPEQPRPVAIGHIWANLFPLQYQKEMILMLTGHWNWRVAARVAKGRQRVFIANQHCEQHAMAHSEPVPEVRSVVAFAPGVIHAGMSKEQYVRAVGGLAQVAVLLGAIAAWPAAPCDSEWALTQEARTAKLARPIQHSIPWAHLDTAYQVQPFGESLAQLQCEWPGFAYYDCLCNRHPTGQEGGRGMLAVEFEHLRNSTRVAPSPQTTLLLADIPSAPPANGTTLPTGVSAGKLLTLNAPAVFTRLQRETMPVFWLDRLVEVTEMTGDAAATFQRWRSRCFALHYLDLPPEKRGLV